MIQVRGVGNRFEGSYRDGRETNPSARLHIDSYAFRYSKSFALANRTSVFYVDAPYGEIQTQNLNASDRGWALGDATFALAHWLKNDPQKQQFGGLVGYLTLPTGDYDAQRTLGGINTNLAQNRWSAAIQAAYFVRVPAKLGFQVAADAMFFGKNDDFRPLGASTDFERRPLYTLQAHLSRRFGGNLMLGLGYYWVTGGEWKVGDQYQNNPLNTHRYQLTTTFDLAPGYRVGAQYGGSLETRNGLHEAQQFSLRFWRFF